jgi:hypothetical protein
MRRENKYMASIFLSAALMAPLGAMAMPKAQQDEHERHEQEEHQRRMYDPYQKDYHNWDRREGEMYRRWLEEKRMGYTEFDKLDHKRQQEYWKWRHRHEEHEEREHEHQ